MEFDIRKYTFFNKYICFQLHKKTKRLQLKGVRVVFKTKHVTAKTNISILRGKL